VKLFYPPLRAAFTSSSRRRWFACTMWAAASQAPRENVPTAGEMLIELAEGEFDGKGNGSGYPDYLKKSIC